LFHAVFVFIMHVFNSLLRYNLVTLFSWIWILLLFWYTLVCELVFFVCECCRGSSGGRAASLFISGEHSYNWVPAAAWWWAVVERRAACARQAAAAERGEPHPRPSAVAHHHRSHSGDCCYRFSNYSTTIFILMAVSKVSLGSMDAMALFYHLFRQRSFWDSWCRFYLWFSGQILDSIGSSVDDCTDSMGDVLELPSYHVCYIKLSTTAVLWPLHCATCVSQHPQLRTRGFVGAKFSCSHALLSASSTFGLGRRCYSSPYYRVCYIMFKNKSLDSIRFSCKQLFQF